MTKPGTYIANVATSCDTLTYMFTVDEIDCEKIIYAANIFSPNDDGINESVEFIINPKLSIEGDLLIYDRWGSMVFHSASSEEMVWDGKLFSGIPLIEGVYVWVFRSRENSIVQSGNVTLIR